MQLTTEELAALQASIAQHEANLEASTPGQVNCGGEDCALCRLVGKNDQLITNCHACPIYRATGHPACRATPYKVLAQKIASWRFCPGDIRLNEAFKEAQQAEVDFLKSLLPEGE